MIIKFNKRRFLSVFISTFVSVFLVSGFVFAAVTISQNIQLGSGTPDLTLNGDDVYVTGTFEVDSAARFDGTLTANGNVTLAASTTVTGLILGANPFLFGGATGDGFETTLAITDPTADRTITFPNLTGTVSLITATETLTNKTISAGTLSATTTLSSGPLVLNKGANIAIGSSGALSLIDDGNIFTVTGNGTSTSISGGVSGEVITLVFSGTAEVGGGLIDNNGTLNLANDFVYTPNDVITLFNDGTNWVEISRSVN